MECAMKNAKIAAAVALLILSTTTFYMVQCSKADNKSGSPTVMVKQAPVTAVQTDQQPQTPVVQQQSNEQAATKETEKQSAAGIKVTFIELGSVNCIPCKMMQPVMKAIEEEYGDQVKVVFHDVWTPEGRPYAEKYGIQAIPTQVFLDVTGKEYHRHTGFFPKEELVKVLQMKGVK